ncbi:hypothetical protein K7432_005213 [Basidiobolus ranarum]|uniref:CENP-V/GFA domain-containing protein n=1 Tax=Basidiobolus ranarum TaxID=34480 RepID=A0ABR2W3L1_9FUNG
MSTELISSRGSCHCGKVEFTVLIPKEITAIDCNCSICMKKGGPHLIVGQSKFHLNPNSTEYLSKYQFGTRVAQHFFCKICGVHPYSIPRSNPDGFDINVSCLENLDQLKVTVDPFDGQNWEQQRSLEHLSAE